MNHDPRISELLESFRPGVDDLADPTWDDVRAPLASQSALQRQAEAIQRRDRVVRSAMHDVPVPPGLAERLLASLPQSARDGFSGDLTAPPVADESIVVRLPSPAVAKSSISRRVWLSASVATALAIALTIVLWPTGPTDSGNGTEEDISQFVASWERDSEFAGGEQWNTLSDSGGLSSHPIRRNDLTAEARRVMGPIGRDALLLATYELVAANGKTARLYVAHTNRKFAVSATPTRTPLPGLTGFRSGVAWQRGEYLYVAVFDPREAGIEDFVAVRELG